MVNKYSPSINIKRDVQEDYLYIPTKNSKEAYNTIADNFKSGIHSYNIIGSYGTGKSAFLLAFYKHLQKDELYFKPVNGQFNGCTKFSFLKVVGNFESLTVSLAKELNVEQDQTVVYEALKNLQNKLKKKNECLVLIIDEFGKTLEYAAKNNPESELYFIQQIAEYANNSKRNFLFLTTLHQNFDAYALGLSVKDRNEWEKVKGRIKELPFNEPVEQMLDLAGQAISSQLKIKNRISLTKKLLAIIKKANLFRLRNELTVETAKNLFPLDPLSASCLLIALQKYGQNERSLFNFISSSEPFGIIQHIKGAETGFYALPNVFDYLMFNYSFLLQSKNNPDFFKWRVIITALDRVESNIESEIDEAKHLIKIIGLLSLLNPNNCRINTEFLKQYFKEVLKFKHIENVLDELVKKKIIKFYNYKDSFSIYEGSDIDIELEIRNKKNEVGQLENRENYISKFLNLDYEVAKAVSFIKGTPRIFKYIITNSPILSITDRASEIDGIINIVINKHTPNFKDFGEVKDPIIYCKIDLNEAISNMIYDLFVIEKILVENELDKVARQELIEYEVSLEKSLISYFKRSMFSEDSKWFIDNQEVVILNEKNLNIELSKLTELIYAKTPVFRNELINRSKLPGSIQHAKKLFISALLENHDKPYLGFEGSKFPPERTIYHSLLEDTGIHISDELKNHASFNDPTDPSFNSLWEVSCDFIESTKRGKRSLAELVDLLRKAPFKLKDGFLEFWLIIFTFIKREEFALYTNGVYVANFSPEVAELLFKKAKTFSIKGIEVDGVRLNLFNKYRDLINKGNSETIKNKGFQEIAKPFLVFYKQLSPYTKQTTKHISKEIANFRETLLNAKELEKTFFDDLPKCFGFSLEQLEKRKTSLDKFAKKIQDSIRELRLQDQKLTDRIFDAISQHVGLERVTFEELREKMQSRYGSEIEHLLDTKQKALVRRIQSQIPERSLWISSISQMLIGKALNKITDDEELVLLNEIKKQFGALDALIELGSVKYDSEKELAIRYEIQGSDKKSKNNQLILTKTDLRDINMLKKEIRVFLKNHDSKVQQGLLLQLLKEID